MKKILPLLLLSAACLSACGEQSYAGVYKFQMGRQGQGETRIGLEMSLSDEPYKIPESYTEEEKQTLKDAKQFELKLDLGNELEEFFEVFDLNDGIKGYYFVMDEKDEKYGNKMAVGMEFTTVEDSPIPITPSLIRNLLVTYVDGSNVTLQLPVSFADLQYQLCWYSGIYIDFDPVIKSKIHNIKDVEEYIFEIITTLKFADLSTISTLPGKTGDARFGSHPEYIEVEDGKDEEGKTKHKVIKDEAAEMNDKYAGEFSNTFVYRIKEDGTKGEKIGSIYQEAENGKNFDVFYPLNKFAVPEDGLFDAYVVQDSFFEGKQDIKVKLNVLTANNDYSINWIHSIGAQAEYQDGDKIDISNIMNDPFDFRDFHDIKVQLKKE